MAQPGSCDRRAAWQLTWPRVRGGSSGCGPWRRFFRLPHWLLSACESGLGQPSRALIFLRHSWPQKPHGSGAEWFPCPPAGFSCSLSRGCLRAALSLAMGLHPFPVGSFKPDTSRQPAGTPRGEPSRGRGEPSAQDSCPASEGVAEGPGGEKYNYPVSAESPDTHSAPRRPESVSHK